MNVRMNTDFNQSPSLERNILVSVIMRSYNHAQYLPEAIESVLGQTVKNIELIIIDDASKDNSPRIINEYAHKDARITAILHKENKGMAVGMNEGLRTSYGTYIAFIDSDDIWERDKLEKQIYILKTNPKSVIWNEGKIIDEQSRPTGQKFTEFPWIQGHTLEGRIFSDLLQGNYILLSSMMVDRAFAVSHPFWEELRYLNDWAFQLEVAAQLRFIFIEEPLTQYRVHSTSTNRDEKGYQEDYLKAYALLLKRITTMPRTARYDMYFRLAILHEKSGNGLKSRYYTLMAFLTDPSKKEARRELVSVLRERLGIRLSTRLRPPGRKIR